MALISFIIVLFPVIIIHELGHLIVGYLLKAKPTEFAIGIGKNLFSFHFKNINFKLNLLPIGGYVKFDTIQFDLEREVDENKNKEKLSATRWIPIAFAGPAANFLFSLCIFTALNFMILSQVSFYTVEDSTHELITKGDRIIKESEYINHSTHGKSDKNIFFINSKNQILVKDSWMSLDSAKIKISEESTYSWIEKLNKSYTQGVDLTWKILSMSFEGMISLFVPSQWKNLSGPVGIAQGAEDSRQQGGVSLLFFMGILSLAVGIFNLIPFIMILDGGRIFIAMVEIVYRKPIPSKILKYYWSYSFIFIAGLFIVITSQDLINLFQK